MLQWIILLLLAATQVQGDNGTIYYSSDGAEWNPITIQNMTNRSGTLTQLQENTLYYLRCENETTNYSFVQRTKPAGEPGMASEGILLFMVVMTASLFLLPKLVGSFSQMHIVDMLAKKSCIIGGLLMLLLTLTVAATISETFGIGVKNEMFGLLSIVGYGIYIMIFFTVLSFGKDVLDSWGKNKQIRQRGREDRDAEE